MYIIFFLIYIYIYRQRERYLWTLNQVFDTRMAINYCTICKFVKLAKIIKMWCRIKMWRGEPSSRTFFAHRWCFFCAVQQDEVRWLSEAVGIAMMFSICFNMFAFALCCFIKFLMSCGAMQVSFVWFLKSFVLLCRIMAIRVWRCMWEDMVMVLYVRCL